MIVIKGLGMPSCCMNCNMFRVSGGQVRPQCAITETYIDDGDEYLDKRADDCPLTEIITCEHCNNHGRNKEHPDIDGARYCSALHIYTGYDFYCGDAERRK